MTAVIVILLALFLLGAGAGAVLGEFQIRHDRRMARVQCELGLPPIGVGEDQQ